MKRQNDHECVWITLIEVEALEGNPDLNRGEKALVNGLVFADSKIVAESRLRRILLGMGFHVISFEDTEEFDKRVSSYEVTPELIKLSGIAGQTHVPQLGDFHTWDNQG